MQEDIKQVMKQDAYEETGKVSISPGFATLSGEISTEVVLHYRVFYTGLLWIIYQWFCIVITH